jgi:hypothetical protein
MAMRQVYPGTVEGVAEAIEVETVAARLMTRLWPRDFEGEVLCAVRQSECRVGGSWLRLLGRN